MNLDYDSSDDLDYTIDCPHCGKAIYEDADQCPYCYQYLSTADFKKRMPPWAVVIVVITIASFLIPTAMIILRFVS